MDRIVRVVDDSDDTSLTVTHDPERSNQPVRRFTLTVGDDSSSILYLSRADILALIAHLVVLEESTRGQDSEPEDES